MSRKTHCKRDHEFTPKNTYWNANHSYRQCRKCQGIRRDSNREKIRENARKSYNKRKDEISLIRRITRPNTSLKLKKDTLTHYGNGKMVCLCCGETTFEFLTLDHINNDGAEDRKKVHRTGHNMYRYLKKMKFPLGYQTLCFNCNSGKQINKGICPHKQIKTIPVYISKFNFSYKIDTSIKEGDRSRLS